MKGIDPTLERKQVHFRIPFGGDVLCFSRYEGSEKEKIDATLYPILNNGRWIEDGRVIWTQSKLAKVLGIPPHRVKQLLKDQIIRVQAIKYSVVKDLLHEGKEH